MSFLIFIISSPHIANTRNKLKKKCNGKKNLPWKKHKQKIVARNQLKSRHLYKMHAKTLLVF